jgi:hypothetical protein
VGALITNDLFWVLQIFVLQNVDSFVGDFQAVEDLHTGIGFGSSTLHFYSYEVEGMSCLPRVISHSPKNSPSMYNWGKVGHKEYSFQRNLRG